MCGGGGGIPVVDDVFDFAGDVVGGIGDLAGDVLEGVADVAGDAVEFIGDNPELAIIAAIIAAPYLAPELLATEAGAAAATEAAAGSFGAGAAEAFTAEELAAAAEAVAGTEYAAIAPTASEAAAAGAGTAAGTTAGTAAGTAAGTGAFTAEELAAAAEAAAGTEYATIAPTASEAAAAGAGTTGAGTGLGSFVDPVQSYEDLAQKALQDLAKQKVKEEITGMLKDTFMPSNQTQTPGQSITQSPYGPTPTFGIPTTNTSVEGTNITPDVYNKGLGYLTYSGAPEYNNVIDIYKKSGVDFGSSLMDSFGTADIGEAVKKYGPTVLQVLGYKLSSDDQKRVNDIISGAYNKYNAGTQYKNLQYATGQGLSSLPIYRSGVPLGSMNVQAAPARTASNVVVRPGAAKGGNINDLYNEYMNINNRMRNYKRYARGGLI
jgi:hypothetical protein